MTAVTTPSNTPHIVQVDLADTPFEESVPVIG